MFIQSETLGENVQLLRSGFQVSVYIERDKDKEASKGWRSDEVKDRRCQGSPTPHLHSVLRTVVSISSVRNFYLSP